MGSNVIGLADGTKDGADVTGEVVGSDIVGMEDGIEVGVVEGAQDGTAVGARDETEMFSSVVVANTVLQSEVGVSSISSL